MPNMTRNNLPAWTRSRAAWGAIAIALGGVLTGFGKFLNGELDLQTFASQVLPLLGIAVGIIGIRFKKG